MSPPWAQFHLRNEVLHFGITVTYGKNHKDTKTQRHKDTKKGRIKESFLAAKHAEEHR